MQDTQTTHSKDFNQIIIKLLIDDVPLHKILAQVQEHGVERSAAIELIAGLSDAHQDAKQDLAVKKILFGAIGFTLGAILTLAGYDAAQQGGGKFVFFWGLIAYGAFKIIAGMWGLMEAKSSKASTMSRFDFKDPPWPFGSAEPQRTDSIEKAAAANVTEIPRTDFPTNLIRGNFGLARTYWLHVTLLPNIAAFALTGLAIYIDQFSLVYAASFLALVYQLYSSIGAWRAGSNYDGSKIWVYLSRLMVIFGAVVGISRFIMLVSMN